MILKKRKQLCDYLPYYSIYDKNTVITKSGLLMRVIGYMGYSHEIDATLAETSDNAITQALHTLKDGWVIWFDNHRKKITEVDEDYFSVDTAKEFDDLRVAYFTEHQHFRTLKYLVVGYQTPSEHLSFLDALVYKGSSSKNFIHIFKAYEEKFNTFIALLNNTALSQFAILQAPAIMTYLNSCVRSTYQPIAYDSMFTENMLDYILGNAEVHVEYPIRINDRHIVSATIADFPVQTRSDMLAMLSFLSIEHRVISRWISLNKTRSLGVAKRKRAHLFSSRKSILQATSAQKGNEVHENIEEEQNLSSIEDSIVRVGSDEILFGYCTSTIITWSDTQAQALENMEQLSEHVEQAGFTVRLERLQCFESYLSSLPGDITSNVRRPIISTRNMAHLVSTNEVYNGEEANTHLQATCGSGRPLIIGSTQGSNVYYFNLHNQDVGHTFIGGKTGGGKSTLLALLLMQWNRYKGSKAYIFDIGKSLKNTAKHLGAELYDIGSTDLAFQPFKMHKDEMIVWQLEYVKTLCALKGYEITPNDEQEITEALVTLKSRSASEQTTDLFMQLIQNKEIKVILNQYVSTDAYGALFNGNTDNFTRKPFVYFEMDRILEYKDDVIIPALLYLFKKIEEQLTLQDPAVIILDECWKYLKNAVFQEKIKTWIKTLRKFNASIVMATQEIEDIFSSEIASTINTNMPTKILLANKTAQYSKEGYMNMNLNEDEIRVIETAIPKKEYYITNAIGGSLVDFHLTGEQLAMLFG